jgi:hypothetical protein
MRRVRVLASMLALLVLAAAAPALATSVTVQISGTWDSVIDNATVLDGSITVGGSFTATLVYDDSVSDLNDDPSIGEYDVLAASSDLSLSTGNYSFAPSSGLGIAIDDDNAFGEDVVFLFAESYVTSGPLPSGISTGGTSYANPTLTDTSGTAYGSDELTALPWSIGSYDLTSFYFFTGVLGAGAGDFIELQGTITGLALLPEPSNLVLVGFGLAALCSAFRRV